MQRWKTLDKIFLSSIGLILLFAYMDGLQIMPFHIINTAEAWDLYDQYAGPAIWVLWVGVALFIGWIWYHVSKDKSEAVGLSSSIIILLWFGLEDIFYFFFSSTPMPACMPWFEGKSMEFVSKYILHECCVSPLGLYLNVGLGIVIAYFVYNYCKRAKW